MFEKTRNGIREMKRAAESLSGYWPDVLKSFIARIEADLAVYDDAPGELEQIAAAMKRLDDATDDSHTFVLEGDLSWEIHDANEDCIIRRSGDTKLPDILAAIELAMPKPGPSIEELEKEEQQASGEIAAASRKWEAAYRRLVDARKGGE
jgi:hypothetical protein